MPYKLLGNVFFARSQPWERKRKAKLMVLVFLAALIFAGCVGAIIYFQNVHPK